MVGKNVTAIRRFPWTTSNSMLLLSFPFEGRSEKNGQRKKTLPYETVFRARNIDFLAELRSTEAKPQNSKKALYNRHQVEVQQTLSSRGTIINATSLSGTSRKNNFPYCG
ncbi:unnamed protein product [Heterobilharzia americana]|nr:unnamed protein product [Heterobilharzia americana]